MMPIACRADRARGLRRTTVRAAHRAVAAALIGALALSAPAVTACGYDVTVGGVSVVHPSSIPVAIAIGSAVSAGRLTPLVDAPAPIALVRANGAMRNFALALQPDATGLPPVAVVLVEAHLWGRAVPDAGRISFQPHVDGPATGDVIVVTGEPALAALLDGRLRWDVAVASGLVVVAGPAEARAQVAGALARQFS